MEHLVMHFNDTASSDNPTPTLPCAQGRSMYLRFDAKHSITSRRIATPPAHYASPES